MSFWLDTMELLIMSIKAYLLYLLRLGMTFIYTYKQKRHSQNYNYKCI